jgi:hypothetical protein
LSRFPVSFHAHSNAHSNAGALVTAQHQAAATRMGAAALL